MGLISASKFGPSVVSSQLGGQSGLQKIDGDQEIMAVPEPSALIAWGFVVVGVVCAGATDPRRGRRHEWVRQEDGYEGEGEAA